MAKRGLAIPTVGAIGDRNIQAAFRSIMDWATSLGQDYVSRDELRLPTAESIQQVVNTAIRKATAGGAAAGKTPAAVNEQTRRLSAQVVRNVLQNSGTEPPIEMRAPQVFTAKNSVTKLFVGAGGIGGGVVDAGDPRGYVPTFGLDSSDGSVFLGKDTVPAKQITFDATAGVLTVGADVRIDIAGYPTLEETYDTASLAYGYASSALSGLTAKLNKTASDILTGAITVNNAGGFCAGTLTWDSNGNRTGGYGVAMTKAGLVGFDSAGNATFAISAGTGAATFAGDVNTAGFIKASGRTNTSGFYAAITGIANQSGDAGGYFEGGANGWGLYAISSRTSFPTIRARHTLAGSGTGYAIHADTNSDSGAAVYAQVNSGSGLAILTAGPCRLVGAVDIQSSLQCDSLRIDQSPTTGGATATFPGNNKPGANTTCAWLSVNLNGTTYYLPAWT